MYPQGHPRGGDKEGPMDTLQDDEPGNGLRTRGQSTSREWRCSCGRSFSSWKGMRIHQGKSKCSMFGELGQRRGQPYKTLEGSSQELHQSAQSSQVLDTSTRAPTTPSGSLRRKQLKLPSGGESQAWRELDQELSDQLGVILKGSIERKLQKFSEVVYKVCEEKFGLVDYKEKQSQKTRLSRRQVEMRHMREEKNILRKRWKKSQEHEKEALKLLWDDVKKRHYTLVKAERARKKRKLRAKRRETFIRDSFKFTKSLFEPTKSGSLDVSKEQLDDHVAVMATDEEKRSEVLLPRRMRPVPLPRAKFDEAEPRWKEIKDIVRKARAGSAPGPNGVPYRILKKCEGVLRILWYLLRLAWRKRVVSDQWTISEGVFIPKEENAKEISQFRPISLLNVEGKLFFGVLARRVRTYLSDNEYINTSVQKDGIQGMQGCVEHSSMVWEAIKTAKEEKRDLHVVWLDLANAYGSIPHDLVQKALQYYHIPEWVSNMVQSYYNNFWIRFSTKKITSRWTQIEKGIPAGCSISPVLFTIAMNVIVTPACEMSPGFKIRDTETPSVKAFMDDMTVICEKRQDTGRVLTKLESAINGVRMRFKPEKSRTLSITKGLMERAVVFRIEGQELPVLADKPVKCLGRWFDASLKDTERGIELVKKAKEGLEAITKSMLPGNYKLWCLQFGLYPRLSWPLMLYEIPLTIVEKLEQSINSKIRAWLGYR